MPIVYDIDTDLDHDPEHLYRCWSCARLMEPQHYGRLCYECEALESDAREAAAEARRRDLNNTIIDIARTAGGAL